MLDTIVVQSTDELHGAVLDAMQKDGHKADLNHIDVSSIRVFDGLFSNSQFEGDISQWNMGNAISVEGMFRDCPFTGDISNWNMQNVERAKSMFMRSGFSGDISRWDVRKLEVANHMFYMSPFNGDISKWDVGALTHAIGMFEGSEFAGDVSSWRPALLAHSKGMFMTPTFHGDLSGWQLPRFGHHTNLVHSTFTGVLPSMEVDNPFEVYGSMLGNAARLQQYAARTPFSLVHADMLLANPVACRWASPEMVQWAQEHKSMGDALGLAKDQLRAMMVRQQTGSHEEPMVLTQAMLDPTLQPP